MESAIISGGYVYDHFMYSLVWGKYDFRWYDESRRIDRVFKLCFTDTEFFVMISNVFLMLTRSLASCERIIEVLDEPLDIHDEAGADAYIEHGTIDFSSCVFQI